jgi:hypothetical protein
MPAALSTGALLSGEGSRTGSGTEHGAKGSPNIANKSTQQNHYKSQQSTKPAPMAAMMTSALR